MTAFQALSKGRKFYSTVKGREKEVWYKFSDAFARDASGQWYCMLPGDMVEVV